MDDRLASLFDRHAFVFAAAIAAFATAEWSRIRSGLGEMPDAREVASNLCCHVVGSGLRAVTRTARVGLFLGVGVWVDARIPTTATVIVATYLAIDLLLYGWHRVLHETELGWALHSVHHSSRRYDLSLGARASWFQRVFDDVIYLPIVLFGVSPAVVLVLIDLNRLSQLWTHSSTIGRLPLLDAVFDTPSNHRVHHRVSGVGRTRNYGSTLVVWDRLFGTYEAESEPTSYGTTLGEVGVHPIRIQLAGLRWYLGRLRGRAA